MTAQLGRLASLVTRGKGATLGSRALVASLVIQGIGERQVIRATRDRRDRVERLGSEGEEGILAIKATWVQVERLGSEARRESRALKVTGAPKGMVVTRALVAPLEIEGQMVGMEGMGSKVKRESLEAEVASAQKASRDSRVTKGIED